ncbi:ubiquitin carboxyl-terminal hydrolase MINDY-2 isoform X2 [Vigna unguiculata]|uniref:ubiquitin carboxyl-terminal hydrolase MINDY-2 isoform X2 n=1 Tax=Vigna unguiculata TaxID=3917 RepID=UPI001016900D|nr:ubiquitin carboxyl-terminal hydrolase MINDY-2 isoform X2 [Vigna unguiculata]
MASSSSPTDQQQLRDEDREEEHPPLQPVKECVHKTKTIQFLGRTTPIVLQNDNGPCPLLAICNVLLLRNNLNLSPDIAEVSQEKLLSLVAERLIDSNSNVNNKDAGYVENQQQNIADAIDLLPRLATGIDVNIKFRRIADFEFTRECAIFDLLDIPLYHGWIVDPQDYDTANAIGSKSYNALMGELVSLETLNMDVHHKNVAEEDCVDFVAATTATLGVPSPSLSKTRSFEDSPQSISDQIPRKGDLEEEAELLRILKLSEADSKASISDPVAVHVNGGEISASMEGHMSNEQVINMDSGDKLGSSAGAGNTHFHDSEPSVSDDITASDRDLNKQISSTSTSTLVEAANSSLKTDTVSDLHQSTYTGTKESSDQNDVIEKNSLDALVQNDSEIIPSPKEYSVSDVSGGDGKIHDQSTPTTIDHEVVGESHGPDATRSLHLSPGHADSDSRSISYQQTDVSGALTSSVHGSEPIYEGEECVLDRRTFEDREPVYEGEVVLAEQADKSTLASPDLRAKDELTPEQGELIKSFLRNNASQLTFYGLFCLQDGLKERELCVFFRNNHFSTMFKYEGELYLLATDQGYINQPDLVWEKLNEVNGDSLFMTSNFKEFKVENHENSTWNESDVLTSTADYLASIDSATQAGLDINSDLQLAIALQQQEFDQQPSRQNNLQQSSISGNSRLVTGPQTSAVIAGCKKHRKTGFVCIYISQA